MSSENLKTNLLKALDRIEKLNPTWTVAGHLGYVPDAENLSLSYVSPDGIHISMNTLATEYYDSWFKRNKEIYESSISISQGHYPYEAGSCSIYKKTFTAHRPSYWRNEFKDGEGNEFTCCWVLRRYIMDIAKPILIAKKEEEERNQQNVKNKFWNS